MGKDALKLAVSKAITLLITLLTGMLLSRTRSLEEYGTYSQILMVVNLFVAFFSLGLPDSINYFVPRSDTKAEKKEFLSTLYSASTVLGLVSGALLLVCMPLVVRYFGNDSIRDFWFALCFLPLIRIISQTVNHLLVVYQKSTKLLVFTFTSSVLLLGAVVFVRIFHLDFTAYMAIYVSVEAGLAIWVYITARGLSGGLAFRIRKEWILSICRYAVPLGLSTAISTLNSELDKLVIGNLMNTEEVALYANAAKELPITVIPTSITAILLPHIVRDAKNRQYGTAVEKWSVAVETGYLFMCFFATVCIVFAPQIMTFLYSEMYLPGVSIFRIYSLVCLLRCTYFGMVLNATGNTKIILLTILSSLMMNIVMNRVLFALVGFEGPAIATVLSISMIQFVQLIFTSRVCGVRFSKLFPWKKMLAITVTNLLLGLSAYLAVRVLDLGVSVRDLMICALIGAVMMTVYALFCYKRLRCLWHELNTFD